MYNGYRKEEGEGVDMPKCISHHCKHGSARNKKPSSIIMHVFPTDINRIKSWLLATGQNYGDLDAFAGKVLSGKKNDLYRLCSAHFTDDSYICEGQKKKLKKNAIPSVFLSSATADQSSDLSAGMETLQASGHVVSKTSFTEATMVESAFQTKNAKNKKKKNPKRSLATIENNALCMPECKEIGINTDYFITKKHTGCNTSKTFGKRNASTLASTKMKDKSTMCNLSDFGFCETPIKECKCLQFSSSDKKKTCNTELIPDNHVSDVDTDDEEILSDSDMSVNVNYESFQPLEISTDDTTEEENEIEELDVTMDTTEDVGILFLEKDPLDDSTFIVFESCLDKLLWNAHCVRYPSCVSSIKRLKKSLSGSFLSVRAICQSGHHFHLWDSQPHKGRLHYGNIMMASAILLSGSNFSKVYNMYQLLNLHQISQSSYYRYQNIFMFPVIKYNWEKEQKQLIESFNGKAIALSGDGQCDSPGFSAKYCIYTLMEQTTKKIINFCVEQISPPQTSSHMEPIAFEKSLVQLQKQNVIVRMICTDRHSSIRRIINDKYANIKHQFDMWHFAKSLRVKLSAACKKKKYSEIKEWISPTINHLWWCARTCNGNPDLLREKWLSLLYHVTNVHQWQTGHLYHECAHSALAPHLDHKRKWMQDESTVFEQFKDIITSRKILDDLAHLSHFCHTGELEVYHSNLLKYRSKRHHYFIDGMIARSQLGALDHNFNVQREQARVCTTGPECDSVGSLRHKLEFTKSKKDWVVKPIYTRPSNSFLFELLKDIIRLACGDINIQWQPVRADLPSNIASKPRPDKYEAVEKHLSRFKTQS
uniref:THAP-type domain-containing protein n=1 Tax=Xenopus tropicalis TaxID=8364 RepID=A0A803KDX7_XENTR